uniref:Intraflagellar transport protein 46 homolog n=1 Tax=Gasterosteus aculeatus aculeatus TaxID=481459 RepID=G3N834_GASAC
MERADRGRDSRLVKNQPYDESLEVLDPEEVPSVHSPTQVTRSGIRRRRRGLMSTNSDEIDVDGAPQRANEPTGRQPVSPNEEEEEEDEDEEEDDSDEEDSDDDEEPGEAPEGVYDPADYANLPVSSEIKELFQYITRYSPQTVELDHSLKPFIPDFIPAVGDIDAFLKVPRPDGKADGLGLLILDEPSVKQSDPTVMSLWMSEESKQHGATEVHNLSVCDERPQSGPRELEELLGRLQLPPARLQCSTAEYAEAVCAMLDIPVYGSRVQSLHLLFSLYLEFRDSQHFTRTFGQFESVTFCFCSFTLAT